ncbi:MAG: glutamate--tRNA ligase [Patescibacteria group bacterium]
MKNVRLRFAPSPTGYLHVGSLRTVLFNYLIAKSLKGKLILRIEDTDQKREVKGATEKLTEILDWIGIKFDEGPQAGGNFGPYIQSERENFYRKYADELLEKGEAYYCFCTPERLEKVRQEQQKKKLAPKYDRACRDLRDEEIKQMLAFNKTPVIRQKMLLEGEVEVNDVLRGKIKFKAQDLVDHVLIKSTGMPTYQFASVVDDHLMEISHVVRGDEWLPSFPKNILLYKAFSWMPPEFIHLPLTLNKEGGKLSKRQGDVTVEDYQAKGYLQEALINFSLLLGWHPRNDKEIFTLDEAIREFKIKDMGISPAVFDIEKLDYLNGYYIRQMDLDKLVELCRPYLESNLKKTRKHENTKTNFVRKVVALEQERLKKLSEIGELTEFFFVDKLNYSASMLIWKKMTMNEVKNNLEQIYKQLEKIPEKNWTNDSIEDALMSFIQAKNEKVGDFLWPMRVALTGQKGSPGPFDVAEVLGKEESLNRVKGGINKLK